MGKTVAITGVNSYFASTILPILEADPEIDRIIGIDVSPWKGGYGKVTFHKEDIRSDKLADLLKGVDVVYHFAFVVGEIPDKKKTFDININGSKNLFISCARNKVKKVIYTSSMTVYGSHKNTPLGLTEESRLAPNKDNYYNSSKVEVEEFLTGFAKEYPDINLVILRAGLLCGPHINNMFSKLWELPISSLPMGKQVQIQFIHEEDLGEALHLALKKNIRGIYNVAADDAIPTKWCFQAAGCFIIPMPIPLLKPMAYLGYITRLFPAGAGWVNLSAYTIYGLSDKFKKATGWKPKYTSLETFNAYLEALAKKRERKRLNNPLQSLVTFVLQHPMLSKPGLNLLNGLLFLIGKTPGLRTIWPWTNLNKNSMTYLPITKIEPRTPFTLPINESVGEVVNEIIPLQILHDFIDRASHHVISDQCFCRVAYDCKNFTPEVGCILMGETTEKLPPALMRKVSKEEAHKHVEKAVKLGLVPVTGKVNFDNTGFLTPDTKKLLSVCFCCHCCCMMGFFKHTPVDHLNKMFPAVEGISVQVTDACKGCGICIETCIFDAVTIQNGKAVHSAHCRGCGRCVMYCPNKAVRISINNPNYRRDVFDRVMSHVNLS